MDYGSNTAMLLFDIVKYAAIVYLGIKAIDYMVLGWRVWRSDATAYESNKARYRTRKAGLAGNVRARLAGNGDFRVTSGFRITRRKTKNGYKYTYNSAGALSDEAIDDVVLS